LESEIKKIFNSEINKYKIQNFIPVNKKFMSLTVLIINNKDSALCCLLQQLDVLWSLNHLSHSKLQAHKICFAFYPLYWTRLFCCYYCSWLFFALVLSDMNMEKDYNMKWNKARFNKMRVCLISNRMLL